MAMMLALIILSLFQQPAPPTAGLVSYSFLDANQNRVWDEDEAPAAGALVDCGPDVGVGNADDSGHLSMYVTPDQWGGVHCYSHHAPTDALAIMRATNVKNGDFLIVVFPLSTAEDPPEVAANRNGRLLFPIARQ